MQLKETIKLRGNPFPKPLPVNADILAEYFNQNGLKFENLDGQVLLLDEIYISDRLPMVKKLIEDKGLNLEITQLLGIEYENEDFKLNPLWILYFPDIWIDEIDFERTCKTCQKKTTVIDLNRKVTHVNSKKPVAAVNGQFKIIKKDLKDKMESVLSGAHFEPFDERGEYFHLLAKSSLGDLVNSPDDFIEYGGICPECKLPIFKIFFSPLKYSKSNWNGDDIVSGAFHDGLFFTEKAYNLIKSVEKKVIRYGVVILQ